MPKKKAKNQSERIRAYLRKHPNVAAGEIAKKLGVKPGLVYNVKSAMKNGSGSKKAAKKQPAPSSVRAAARANGAPVGAAESEQPILVAARLIKACGSAEKAEQAVRDAVKVAQMVA